ncbi:MAG: acyltransferase [Proteobacteria bacterium]|nr:MAG: acyltransferase [Pseudomonadota bacterium]
MTYRREIDGLRAVAVLSVIIYHLGLVLNGNVVLSGGFLGVDVFFVISGYLISANLFREMSDNRFSFLKFYEKRARRILPAMLFVTMITVPFAWTVMFPPEFKEYAGSVLASILSVANFYFLGLDSYTAGPSAFKPMLHMWSLSVEEQYYLIIPAFLLLLWKFQKKHLEIWIVSLLLMSLMFAIWFSIRNPDASFFLLPSRCWELLTGAALAILGKEKSHEKYESLNSKMAGTGLFLLIVSMLFLKDKYPHPSYPTIIPVLGTALIIKFGGGRDWTTRLLSSKFMVGIGLISYSLYLWHQPIFAFTKISTNDLGPKYLKVLEIGATFIAAFLTWKFVEKPFRNKTVIRNKKFWTVLVVSNFALMFLGIFVYRGEGLPDRLNSVARQVYENDKGVEFSRLSQDGKLCRGRRPADACRFKDQSWVLLGDSHAGVFGPSLNQKLSEKSHGLIDLTFDQCSLINGMRFGNMAGCGKINEERWLEINSWKSSKTIFLSADTALFDTAVSETTGLPVPKREVVIDFNNNINRLISLGHRVVLIYPVPDPGFEAQDLLASLAMKSAAYQVNQEHFSSLEDSYSQTIAKHANYDFVKDNPKLFRIFPSEILCPADSNGIKRCVAIGKEGSYYNGGMHLSGIGATKILNSVFSKLDVENPAS